MKDNIIQTKSLNFSLEIIALYIKLKAQNEFVLSKQLLRSATSIGANVEEALAGSSRKDFLNKIVIASKEARETRYWLILLQKSNLVDLDYSKYLLDIESIINILTKIAKTTSEK